VAVELNRHRFTRDDYHRMAQTGILAPDARVELIDGEIIEMSPIGNPHTAAVTRATHLFVRGVGDDAIVRIQCSIALGDNGEPEPDVALVRYRDDFYSTDSATEEDVLLLVEVADSSLAYDQHTKAPLYARYGIPELWIANLNRDQLIVHRDPTPTGYATVQVHRRGESISPLAFPGLVIPVESILG